MKQKFVVLFIVTLCSLPIVLSHPGCGKVGEKDRAVDGRRSESRSQRDARPLLHESPQSESAVIAVIPAPPKFPILAWDFASIENPYGDGAIVYIPNKTEFNGVERHFAWFVLNDSVYNLNGATAALTPKLPWTRDAPAEIWITTGLDITGNNALRLAFPDN